MSTPSNLTVGPADATRSALGLLLPCWFYVVGLINGVAAALGQRSASVNTAAAIIGFLAVAGVEILRRVVLASRPDGGRNATLALRAIVKAMLAFAVPIICLLAGDLLTGCFGHHCGEDTTIAISLWLGVCTFCLLTTPLAWHLLRRSEWLQPR